MCEDADASEVTTFADIVSTALLITARNLTNNSKVHSDGHMNRAPLGCLRHDQAPVHTAIILYMPGVFTTPEPVNGGNMPQICRQFRLTKIFCCHAPSLSICRIGAEFHIDQMRLGVFCHAGLQCRLRVTAVTDSKSETSFVSALQPVLPEESCGDLSGHKYLLACSRLTTISTASGSSCASKPA